MWTIWSIIKCILMVSTDVEIWFTSSQIASFLYQKSMELLPRNEDNSSTIFSK